jgi:hypothetical protein
VAGRRGCFVGNRRLGRLFGGASRRWDIVHEMVGSDFVGDSDLLRIVGKMYLDLRGQAIRTRRIADLNSDGIDLRTAF